MTRRMSKQHLALAIEFEALDPHTNPLSRLNLGVFIRPRRCQAGRQSLLIITFGLIKPPLISEASPVAQLEFFLL